MFFSGGEEILFFFSIYQLVRFCFIKFFVWFCFYYHVEKTDLCMSFFLFYYPSTIGVQLFSHRSSVMEIRDKLSVLLSNVLMVEIR